MTTDPTNAELIAAAKALSKDEVLDGNMRATVSALAARLEAAEKERREAVENARWLVGLTLRRDSHSVHIPHSCWETFVSKTYPAPAAKESEG